MSDQTRIIAVANEKGGVGKTAAVVNLSAAIVSQGRKVLIIDMDPQANATKGLGLDTDVIRWSTYDIITKPPSFFFAEAIIKSRWEGLDLSLQPHLSLAVIA